MAGRAEDRGAAASGTASDVLSVFQTERLVTRPFLFLVLEAERPLSGGARFALAGTDEVLIGRGSRRRGSRDRSGGKRLLSVTVNSTYLSSVHARLSEEPEGWTIEDLNSRNGVFVNGQPVTRAALSPGDVVALGRVFFLVEFHEVPASSADDPAANDFDVTTSIITSQAF
jgi:pSer/pThr/pTyr-binding forkhead associated (FHA) protein